MLALSSVGGDVDAAAVGDGGRPDRRPGDGSVGLLGAAVGLAAAGYAPRFPGAGRRADARPVRSGRAINTASGRVVTSWFPREERGLALGIRQTSVPIGGFAAALAVPPIADHWERRRRSSSLAAYSLLGAVLAAALASWRGRCARRPRTRPTLLRHPIRDRRIWRLSLRQFGADLHAGRGHRVRRPLPRVATRLLGDRGGPRARADQRASARPGASGPAGAPTAAAADAWR